MKHIAILCTILLLAGSAVQAREATLFSDGNLNFGGFGGPGVFYTQFNGQAGVLVGGEGAVLINHFMYFGGGGYGLANRAAAPGEMIDGVWHDMRFEMGYGGGLLGVILHSDQVVHATADVLFGGGGITRTSRDWEHGDQNDDWDNHRKSDAFFMVQPMAHMQVNVTHWMRVDAGAGYRLVSGVNEFNLNNSDVAGPVAGLTFRFGRF